MAHYRKITVDKKEYLFNIGKNFVKIKGIGDIEKKDFFKDSRGDDREVAQQCPVSPGMIADYINGKKIRDIKLKRSTPQCNCSKPLSEKSWRSDPFDAEIHQDYHYAMWCDECIERRSWDI